MNIRILDSVHCQVPKKDVLLIAPCLKYKKEWWQQGPFRKEKKVYDAYMVNKRTGIFLTGLLPKVCNYCTKRYDESPQVDRENVEVLKVKKKPALPGITFRDDQLKLIELATLNQRGVILSPTGSGKTIVMLGLISQFPKASVLILCHSVGIVTQTFDELKKFGFKDLCMMGGGKKKLHGKIVVSTIQTLVKLDPALVMDKFDIVIIDEVHHCQSLSSQYGKVMQKNLAPCKFGFTATLPVGKEKELALEGLIGPVIGKVSINEAAKLGILAKPEIKLIPVPLSPSIADYMKYQQLYKYGIVQNRYRNRLIMKNASVRIQEGKSVLIMVKEILHGEALIEIAEEVFDFIPTFIRGETQSIMREQIKASFEKKDIGCVISTAVWREGINIRTLDTVINACGGRSEIMTLQSIGRGLRKTKEKDSVLVIDFLDPYKYLATHAILRLQIYVKNGWI